jgi:hypothetical protein
LKVAYFNSFRFRFTKELFAFPIKRLLPIFYLIFAAKFPWNSISHSFLSPPLTSRFKLKTKETAAEIFALPPLLCLSLYLALVAHRQSESDISNR